MRHATASMSRLSLDCRAQKSAFQNEGKCENRPLVVIVNGTVSGDAKRQDSGTKQSRAGEVWFLYVVTLMDRAAVRSIASLLSLSVDQNAIRKYSGRKLLSICAPPQKPITESVVPRISPPAISEIPEIPTASAVNTMFSPAMI